MLQSGARASKAMSWTTSDSFVLERQKRTFRRNPRRTKLLFRACKTLDFPLSSDLSKGFAPEIYSINVNMYKLLQFRTLPSSSWHCVMSSPTRPFTDAVAMFFSIATAWGLFVFQFHQVTRFFFGRCWSRLTWLFHRLRQPDGFWATIARPNMIQWCEWPPILRSKGGRCDKGDSRIDTVELLSPFPWFL